MKQLLLRSTLFLVLVGCSKESVTLPDYKGIIDSNTARIMLLEANDALQDLRIDSLETKVSSLEARMIQAEDDIDNSESNISVLFDQVQGLSGDLDTLRNDFRRAVRQLRAADRRTRRELRSSVRSLRQALRSEIRTRRLADRNLQDQIDSVQSELDGFEAVQTAVNRILTTGLFLTNLRITHLQSQISSTLANLSSRVGSVEAQVATINGEIATMQGNITALQARIDDVESRLVSVVYPCGEGNSQEVLLKTQDGLVAYFQQTHTVNQSIPVFEQIPGYAYCNHPWKTLSNCPHGLIVNVPATTNQTNQTVNVSYQVLDKAYLDVLGNGTYGTTDGYSCVFSISNGEVQ